MGPNCYIWGVTLQGDLVLLSLLNQSICGFLTVFIFIFNKRESVELSIAMPAYWWQNEPSFPWPVLSGDAGGSGTGEGGSWLGGRHTSPKTSAL